MPKIVVNWLLCEGNGVCTEAAPELLAMQDDDTLIVLKEEFGGELQSKAEAAVRICPKHALKIDGT